MFEFKKLKDIHLEITSKCQAACPMCERNNHGAMPNPNLIESDWSLEDFKKIMSPNLLNQIKSLRFCGNFGDPIINDNLIEMCRYTKLVDKNINIDIHTNAGARKQEWWQELASVLTDNDRVHIALDGLEDTHHLYRINTTYDKVIKNAKAFIDAGGKAVWAMLIFKHNEHQVEEANRRANDMNFVSFSVKASQRFITSLKFEVYDKNKNITHYLEPASNIDLNYITKEHLDKFELLSKSAEIKCEVKHSKEVYIDAQKILSPCCYIAPGKYLYTETNLLKDSYQRVKEQYLMIVESLGGFEKLNTINNTVEDIINSKEYQTVWDYYWSNNKPIMCVKSCSKIDNVMRPQDQYIKKA
jgi:MoaA/NifB/PqqE/SkfB family radical SAM enzyme